MRTVTTAKVATTQEATDELPERVQGALGELAGAAKEGLLALSVGVGLGVLHELMACEMDQLVGPKGRHDPERTAKRHGHEDGSVTLGGRRVAVSRPRVRSAGDEREEVPLATHRHFADRDPLNELVVEQMRAGVSTRTGSRRVGSRARASRLAPRSKPARRRRASRRSRASSSPRCARRSRR